MSDLVTLAESTPAGRLGAAIAAWSQRHDDPEVIARRQRAARSCGWRSEPDGMVVLTARLTLAAAGAVCAVIDTVVTASSASEVMECRADAGAGDDMADRPYRSLAQQRADALVELVTGTGACARPRGAAKTREAGV